MTVYVPWPNRWRAVQQRARPATTVAWILAVLFGLASIFTLLGGRTGAVPLLVYGMALSAAAAVAIQITLLAADRGVTAAEQQANGTIYFPMKGSAHWVRQVFYLICFIAFASAPWTTQELTSGTMFGEIARFVAPALPVVSAYPLAVLASGLVRKKSALGVGLNANGVYHWSWFGCCFFAWDSIAAVWPSSDRLTIELAVDEPEIRKPDPEENWVAKIEGFRRRQQRIPAGYLAGNSAVPLYALVFYHRYPDLRHELGTENGIRRIRELDFPELISEVDSTGELGGGTR